MRIQIGPHRHCTIYHVVDSPACWVLDGSIPRCQDCGRQVHLVFIEPEGIGRASCACERIGERKLIRTMEALR